MKPLINIQKVIVFLLALVLCASMVGTARAGFTIQQLINAAVEGSTVNIAAGTFSESLTVNKNLTLKGVSLSSTILQPAGADQRVITVTGGKTLHLEYLRVTGATLTSSGGGGVYIDGSLFLDHVQIDHNQATYGGGVYQDGAAGSVSAINSMIDNNVATITGGGMYTEGSASLEYTSLINNTAGNHGGGMHVNSGTADLYSGAVSGNYALNGNGGGVNVNDGLNVVYTQFASNKADGTGGGTGSGGAITQWNSGKSVSIYGATFNNNSAQVSGGAVYIRENFLNLSDTTFTSNTANTPGAVSTYGGGVYAGGGLYGSYLVFNSNSAKCTGCSFSVGGGLYVTRLSTGASSINHSTFNGNLAWFGSGISSNTTIQLTLTDCSFINNGGLISGAAGGYGGGVDAYWVHGDRLFFQNNKVINFGGGLIATESVLTNSRFIDNATGPSGSGGGVYTYSSFSGTNLLFEGNDSGDGSALYINGGSAVLRHATIGRPARGTGTGIFVKASSTLELKNSIISAYATGLRSLGTATEDYNLYFNNGVDYDKTGGGTINYGAHNIALQDPLFVNPAGHDYHLRWLSPAIGKGTNLGVTADLDGRPRLGRMDIGAYQFWTKLSLPLIRK